VLTSHSSQGQTADRGLVMSTRTAHPAGDGMTNCLGRPATRRIAERVGARRPLQLRDAQKARDGAAMVVALTAISAAVAHAE
jgi:hypothetical protein